MRVFKSKVALLSLAVAGVFASANASAATLTLAATCPASSIKLAVELPPAAAATVGTAEAVVATLGFGVAGGQRRFVRFELAPGAKFGTAIAIKIPMINTTIIISTSVKAPFRMLFRFILV